MSQKNLDNSSLPLKYSSRNLGSTGNVPKQSEAPRSSSPLASTVTTALQPEQAKSLVDIPTITSDNNFMAANQTSKSRDMVSDAADQANRRRTSFNALQQGPAADVSSRSRLDRNEPISSSAYLRKDNTTSSATGSSYLRGSKELNSSRHFYSQEETSRCAEWINTNIKPRLDADLSQVFPDGKPLPIEPGEICDQALFGACRDGLLLWKMLESVQPGVIDSKKIWKPAKNTAQSNENMALILQGAQNIGVKLSNIGAADIINGTPHLILALIWHIIKISLLSKINLNAVPGLSRLLTDSEKTGDTSKISNESLLMKWVNFHLAAAGENARIFNFAADVKQGEIFAILLQQLVPKGTETEEQVRQLYENYQKTSTIAMKANKILDMALALGIKPLISAKEIVQGNKELSIAFFAQLFERYPNLEESLAKHTAIINNSKERLDQLERIAELEKLLGDAQNEISILKSGGQTTDAELLSKQKLLDEASNRKREVEERFNSELDDLKVQIASKDEQLIKMEEINRSLTLDLGGLEQKHKDRFESQVLEFQQQSRDKDTRLVELQQELKIVQDNSSALELKLKDVEGSIIDSQEYIEMLQRQNQDLANNLQSSSEMFESQMEKLKRDHDSRLESETSFKTKIIEGYEKQLKDLSAEIEAKNEIIKKAHAKRDEHLRIIQAVESSSAALQATLQRNENEIQELKSKNEVLLQEKKKLHEALQKEQIHVKEEIEHEYILENDKKDLKHTISQYQSQIGDEKKEIESLLKTIQGKDFEINQLKERHATEMESLEEKKSSLIRAHQTELHSVKLKLTTKEEMLQKAETNIQTFQSTLTYFETTIQKYEAELQEASANFETTIKEMEDEKQQLLKQHSAEANELKTKLEFEQQVLLETKQDLERSKSIICDFEVKNRDLETCKLELQESLAGLNQQIQELQSQDRIALKQHQQEIINIENKHSNEILEKDQKIADLLQRVDSRDGVIQDLMNENEMIMSNSNSIKSAVQKYETEIQNLKLTNDAVLAEMQTRATEHEGQLSDLKGQLRAKEELLVKAEQKKKEFLKDIQSLNHNLSKLQDNYDKIVEAISKSHGVTHNGNNPVGVFERIIESHTNRVSELETIINGLQKEIASLKSSGTSQKLSLDSELRDVRAALKKTGDEMANWKATCDILQKELDILSAKSYLNPIDSDSTFMKLQAMIRSTAAIRESLESTNVKHKSPQRQIESNILRNMQELESEANDIDVKLKT